MKKILLLMILAFVSSFFAVFAQDRESQDPEIVRIFSNLGLPVFKQRAIPMDFSLPLLDGGARSLKDLRGKVVFLNFWATWCGPCRAEMPSMENLYSHLKSRGLEMLAVNLQEENKDVAAFMKQNNLSFPVALDRNGSIGDFYGVRAIPTTIIIDREGKMLSRITGSMDWNRPELIALFEALVDKK
jgi:thiol-disulfide isomerase/thioredoxin